MIMIYNMASANTDHVKPNWSRSLICELMTNFDKNIYSDLILMNFAKAFDTVPHQRLLYKLQWYGMQDITYR